MKFLKSFNFQKKPLLMSIFYYSIFKELPLEIIQSLKTELNHDVVLRSLELRYLLKGGDPSPRSRRDTLLRLNPNHRSYLRQLPPYG